MALCVTDFDNPLIREWSLLCVRNACEGNDEIQEYIKSLRPQEVQITDDSLEAVGLSVRIDSTTGKLVVDQKTKATTSQEEK